MKENLSDQDINLLEDLSNYPKELYNKTVYKVLLIVVFIIVMAVFFNDYFSLIGLVFGLLALHFLVYKPMAISSNLKKKDVLLGVKNIEELRVKQKLSKRIIMNNDLNLDVEDFNIENINFNDVLVGEKYLIEYTPHSKFILKIEKL